MLVSGRCVPLPLASGDSALNLLARRQYEWKTLVTLLLQLAKAPSVYLAVRLRLTLQWPSRHFTCTTQLPRRRGLQAIFRVLSLPWVAAMVSLSWQPCTCPWTPGIILVWKGRVLGPKKSLGLRVSLYRWAEPPYPRLYLIFSSWVQQLPVSRNAVWHRVLEVRHVPLLSGEVIVSRRAPLLRLTWQRTWTFVLSTAAQASRARGLVMTCPSSLGRVVPLRRLTLISLMEAYL